VHVKSQHAGLNRTHCSSWDKPRPAAGQCCRWFNANLPQVCPSWMGMATWYGAEELSGE